MSPNDDPVLGRLDDALARVTDMEQRASRGEPLPLARLASELRAVREDLLAERRDVVLRRAELEARLKDFLPRQPYQRVGGGVIAFLATVGAAIATWWITGKGQ